MYFSLCHQFVGAYCFTLVILSSACCYFHLLSSSSSSLTLASTLFLDCLTASSSSLSTSCSPDSSSTLAMRSFFTMLRAFLSSKENRRVRHQNFLQGNDKCSFKHHTDAHTHTLIYVSYLVSRSCLFSVSRFSTSLPIPETVTFASVTLQTLYTASINQ